jgi:tetratricopeptide (TPR) repeat protein
VVNSIRHSAAWLCLAGLGAFSVGCSLTQQPDSDLAAKVTSSNSSGGKSSFNLLKSSGLSNSSDAAGSTPGSPDFSTSNKLKDPVKVHLAYALWHEQEGNLVEARNSYNKVLEKSSKNVDAMLGLARLDIAMNRMDDAEQRLQKAQKLAPKNPQVAVSLGQYYAARSDWPRALEQMKMARVLAPYDLGCAYHLGFVQAKSGDLVSALTNFTEAVGAAEAEYNVGYILYEQGNVVAAEEHLQKSIAMKPDLAKAQSLLLTTRQKRYGNKNQMAQSPSSHGFGDHSFGIQPASYTEFAPPVQGTSAPTAGR